MRAVLGVLVTGNCIPSEPFNSLWRCIAFNVVVEYKLSRRRFRMIGLCNNAAPRSIVVVLELPGGRLLSNVEGAPVCPVGGFTG